MTQAAALVCGLLVLLPSLVSAQDGRTMSPADRERARGHSQTARQLQREGRFDEAIVEYEKAYDLAPLPDLLFNIAQCHRLSGNAFMAIQFYRRYIAADPDGRGAEEAREHVASLQPELDRTREPDWAAPLPPAPVEPPPPPDRRTRRFLHQASIYTVAAGGVVLVAGFSFGLRAENIESEVRGSTVFTPELAERAREGDTWHDLMIGAYIAGGLLVAGGATTFVLTREEPAPARLTLRPLTAPGVLALGLDGQF